MTLDDKRYLEVYAEEEEGKREIYSKSTNTTKQEGRFGIIALVESISNEFEEHHWGRTEYENRPPILWKWEAKAKIVHVGGSYHKKLSAKYWKKKIIIILEVGG